MRPKRPPDPPMEFSGAKVSIYCPITTVATKKSSPLGYYHIELCITITYMVYRFFMWRYFKRAIQWQIQDFPRGHQNPRGSA